MRWPTPCVVCHALHCGLHFRPCLVIGVARYLSQVVILFLRVVTSSRGRTRSVATSGYVRYQICVLGFALTHHLTASRASRPVIENTWDDSLDNAEDCTVALRTRCRGTPWDSMCHCQLGIPSLAISEEGPARTVFSLGVLA